MKVKFKIKGLDCANCAAELERAIQKVEGISEASISFITEKLIIECKEQEKEEIIDKIIIDNFKIERKFSYDNCNIRCVCN